MAFQEGLVDGLLDHVKADVFVVDVQTCMRGTLSRNTKLPHHLERKPFVQHGWILRIVSKNKRLQPKKRLIQVVSIKVHTEARFDWAPASDASCTDAGLLDIDIFSVEAPVHVGCVIRVLQETIFQPL